MPFAAAVVFAEGAFPKYYDPGDSGVRADDFCLAHDAEFGIDRVGFVSSLEGRAPIQMLHLPKVRRRAEPSEIEAWRANREREAEAIEVARERAAAHGLTMKIGRVVVAPESNRVFVHYTSDHRIDFRELVRDLASRLKARIEMWQVNPRKEAGAMDGYGICGNRLCCSNWLKDFPSVAMRHAKEQDIVQPPSKLSGPCGRLRCCLRYEHEQYVAMAVGAPALGCSGCSSGGACGVVVERNLLKGEAVLRTEGGTLERVPFDRFEAEKGAPTERRPPAKNAAPPDDRRRRNPRARGRSRDDAPSAEE